MKTEDVKPAEDTKDAELVSEADEILQDVNDSLKRYKIEYDLKDITNDEYLDLVKGLNIYQDIIKQASNIDLKYKVNFVINNVINGFLSFI